jgi:phage FluMu gp28-like protein
VRHALLDQAILQQAKQLLSELDSQVMVRTHSNSSSEEEENTISNTRPALLQQGSH